MTKIIYSNKILLILSLLVVLGVLTFNVFHYSQSYGVVEINNINALFLIPFIGLIFFFGILLGKTKSYEDFEVSYANEFTKREKEVIKLLAQGLKNKEISKALFVEISTVKSHINNIYKKTGATNRKELNRMAKLVLEKG